MKPMEYEGITKTIGIAYPDKDENGIYLEYMFTEETEKRFKKFLDTFGLYIYDDWNVGMSKYFCYLDFDFSVSDEKILEIAKQCTEWLNKNGGNLEIKNSIYLLTNSLAWCNIYHARQQNKFMEVFIMTYTEARNNIENALDYLRHHNKNMTKKQDYAVEEIMDNLHEIYKMIANSKAKL